MKKYLISFLIGLSLFAVTGINTYAQTNEMSAAWISTVYNLDWPSSNSKNNPQMQKQELITMLDKLKETGTNTVILQVRPKADALYNSSINPCIKSVKSNVKFGVSPSGIWRNKSSDSTGSDTKGSESYSTQYADTRYWIKNSLVDYVTPQLYWPIGYSVADYSKLVSWWANEVSGSNVNLYIGQGIYKQGAGDWIGQDIAGQIIQQVNLNRQYPNIKGSMYFSARDIISNKNLQEDLKTLYINGSIQ